MDIAQESLRLHRQWRGKLEINSKARVNDGEALSLAYTPGVAQPCLEIAADKEQSWQLTGRWNTVAVVTDGSAVLGLGDIGPEAAMPVMEGKCVLFKEFGGVNAMPLCIRSKEVDQIVQTVALLAGSFGGINLEDIAAPRCFEVERRLKALCDIPIFHDDQHGTAIVVLAALLGALRLAGKEMQNAAIVVNGAGSAGIAIAKLLLSQGVGDLLLCDRQGIIYREADWLNPVQSEMSLLTNKGNRRGNLADAMAGADVFIGVSAPGIVTGEMVKTMAKDAILFPLANPAPEIMPEEAYAAGAAIVGTGRSDFPNQINNVLAFPGIFRGALDVRAKDISEAMKLAAAHALADLVGEDLSRDYILPAAFDPRIRDAVASAVAAAAIKDGIAQANPS